MRFLFLYIFTLCAATKISVSLDDVMDERRAAKGGSRVHDTKRHSGDNYCHRVGAEPTIQARFCLFHDPSGSDGHGQVPVMRALRNECSPFPILPRLLVYQKDSVLGGSGPF